jgi:hypothetical protein
MTLISPYKHLQATPVNVSFSAKVGNLAQFTFTGGSNNFYADKPVIVNVGANKFSGVYLQNDDGDFIDFGATVFNQVYPLAATILDSFEAAQTADNETITMRDLMVNGLGTPDTFVAGNMIKRGKAGLVKGFDILKLSKQTLPNRWKQTVNYINSAIATQLIGVIKFGVDELSDATEHVFTMVNDFIDMKFVIRFAHTGMGHADADGYTTSPFTVECQQFSTYGDKNLNVILEVVRQYTGTECLAIYARFVNIVDDSASVSVQVNHYLNDRSNLLEALPPTDGTTTSNGYMHYVLFADASNAQFNYTQGTSKEFIFSNGGTVAYTQNGPVRQVVTGLSSMKPISIINGGDVNTICFPGYYFCHIDADVATILNLPDEVINRFNLEVFPLLGLYDTIGSNRQVIQRLTTWITTVIGPDTFVHSAIFERISNISNGIMTWSDWEQNGKAVHTHSANDIIETSEKNFVSQTEIDTWNAFLENTSDWANQVATFAELTGDDGTTQFVAATGLFYTKIDGTWVATSANSILDAAANQKGLVTIEQFAKWDNTAISRLAAHADSFIYYNNNDNVYGAAFVNLPNLTMDIVKRTSALSSALGSKSVNFGFDDTQANGTSGIAHGTNVKVSGNNAIGIGSNIVSTFDRIIAIGTSLNVDRADATVLGKFNLPLVPQNLAFAFGNGVDAANRSNLFGVTIGGVFVGGGYSVTGKDNFSLLTAGGDTLLIADLITSAITAVANAYVFNKKLLGDMDGVNVSFTLPDMPVDGKVALYFNGQRLFPSKNTDTNDYSIDGMDITMSLETPPVADDLLIADYIIDTTYIG